jgi:hypothetical protein
MKKPVMKLFAIVVVCVIAFSLVPLSVAQAQTREFSLSFLLQNRPGGDQTYELNVTISQALYQYYLDKSHFAPYNEFAMFVTPEALKPIADQLWQIYNNTEDFTNGVLMLVHQLTYQATIPEYYPIETLAAGKGDCDLFSFIAASILEAGGVQTVLLYYESLQHMNIGVDLGATPKEGRYQVYSIQNQNVAYYVAECTGENWQDGWRVGESPEDYKNASVQVKSLAGMEQSSAGQVSASLRALDPSTVTIQLSPAIMLENSQVTISGQILPSAAKENVTIQAKIWSSAWTTIGTVLTGQDGRFTFIWTPQTNGVVPIQAFWQGNSQNNGASTQTNVTILPLYLVALIVTIVAAVVVVTFTFFMTRPKKQTSVPYSMQQDISPPP